MPGLRRREFVSLFGGAAVTRPLSVRAQQQTRKVPRIGFLGSATAASSAKAIDTESPPFDRENPSKIIRSVEPDLRFRVERVRGDVNMHVDSESPASAGLFP